jgi:hypothetical protein
MPQIIRTMAQKVLINKNQTNQKKKNQKKTIQICFHLVLKQMMIQLNLI